MKCNEFIRLAERNGWKRKRQSGSYIIFVKGNVMYPIPNHGSKEMSPGLERKAKREMRLK